MEIIKHGNAETLSRLRIKFECPYCNCEFAADRTEYEEFAGLDNNYPIQVLRVRCPECGEPCRSEVRYD